MTTDKVQCPHCRALYVGHRGAHGSLTRSEVRAALAPSRRHAVKVLFVEDDNRFATQVVEELAKTSSIEVRVEPNRAAAEAALMSDVFDL